MLAQVVVGITVTAHWVPIGKTLANVWSRPDAAYLSPFALAVDCFLGFPDGRPAFPAGALACASLWKS